MAARTLLLAISSFSLGIAATAPAGAKEIPLLPPEGVKAACGDTGGTYLPPDKGTGAYGCVQGNGTMTVCGGAGKDQKNSCTTTADIRKDPNGRKRVGDRSARFRR